MMSFFAHLKACFLGTNAVSSEKGQIHLPPVGMPEKLKDVLGAYLGCGKFPTRYHIYNRERRVKELLGDDIASEYLPKVRLLMHELGNVDPTGCDRTPLEACIHAKSVMKERHPELPEDVLENMGNLYAFWNR